MEELEKEIAWLDREVLRGSIFKSTATHVKRAYQKIAVEGCKKGYADCEIFNVLKKTNN